MHNGNMLKTASGQLAYIDFGVMCEIPKSVREAMVLALFYLIHGEYTMLAEACVGLALMPPDAVEDELVEFTAALEAAFGRSQKSAVLNRFTMIGVAEKLLQLGGSFPFVFNASFLNSFRCLGMLEGLAINADPNFNVLNVVYPFLMRKVLGGRAGTPYRLALERVLKKYDGMYDWGKLDDMLQEMRRAENCFVGRRSHKRAEVDDPLDNLLLSSDGAFLRKQLMMEWGKGGHADEKSNRASQMFRRASITGKVRAMCAFLPAMIMHALVVAFKYVWRVFRALFRRNAPPVDDGNENVSGNDGDASRSEL